MTMRLRMLGSRVNQKTAAPSTGFFHSAMDNPEYLCVEEFDVVILDLVTVVCLNTHCQLIPNQFICFRRSSRAFIISLGRSRVKGRKVIPFI